MSPPLRLAVVVDGRTAPTWQADVVASLEAWEGCSIVRLLAAGPRGPEGPAQRRWWSAVQGKVDALRPTRVRCSAPTSPAAWTDAGRDELIADGADALVHLGALPPPATWSEAFPHGVWVLRHGEGSQQAPGLREILDDAPTTRVRLLRLGAPLAEVLHEGAWSTHPVSYRGQLQQLLSGSTRWVLRVARELAELGALRGEPAPLQQAARVRTADLLRLPAVLGRRLTVRQVRGFTDRAQWNVGIVDRPLPEVARDGLLRDVRWIRPPEDDGYIADPFGLEVDGRTVIMAEHYGFGEEHGRIVALDDGDGFSAAQVVMDAPVHQSFPYLLRHEGEVYCIPERGAARELALYRAVDFPTSWERAATLLEDIPAIDASLFHHEGQWWIFAMDGDSLPAVDLHAWWAPDLEGPWTPHLLNPLKTDVAGARCAGRPWMHEGKLYRPAQDCSRTYGGAVAIYEVEELTPTRFRERWVGALGPDPDGEYPEGVHTLVALGDRTLVDGKRWVISRKHIRRQLERKLLRR